MKSDKDFYVRFMFGYVRFYAKFIICTVFEDSGRSLVGEFCCPCIKKSMFSFRNRPLFVFINAIINRRPKYYECFIGTIV
jgi:hypothetical protein